MNATTVKEAKKNLDRLIEQVNADAEPTIICGDQGQKAVLLSFEEFNSWQETLYLLSSPANAEHIRQSIAEAKAGKTLGKASLVSCPLNHTEDKVS
jgi:antitoxin YefM